MIARVIAVAILVALLLILAGCGTAPRLQTVKVAVPVQCTVQVPERPAMPTEALAPGISLFDFTKAAQAEIERREGYEGQLREALAGCVTPQP
jgi:hypothetical protein